VIEEIAPSFGIIFQCFDVTNEQEMLPALEKIKSTLPHFDAIYVPSGAPFTENSEIIFNFGRTKKIAMISEREDMIRDGALMGTVIRYEEGGELAAKILDMHHCYQIAMDHIPLQYSKFYCLINEEVAEALGVHPDARKINFLWVNGQK
jgi:ABC-type uncharacterized transport system substrate-binding protein